MKLRPRVPNEEVQVGMITKHDCKVVGISENGFYIQSTIFSGLVNLEKNPNSVLYTPKDDVTVIGFPDAVS